MPVWRLSRCFARRAAALVSVQHAVRCRDRQCGFAPVSVRERRREGAGHAESHLKIARGADESWLVVLQRCTACLHVSRHSMLRLAVCFRVELQTPGAGRW